MSNRRRTKRAEKGDLERVVKDCRSPGEIRVSAGSRKFDVRMAL